jgi:hypothetical protein
VPLNSVSVRRKVVFCESVGSTDGYSAGRGVEGTELQRMIRAAMEMGEQVTEAANAEIERIHNE